MRSIAKQLDQRGYQPLQNRQAPSSAEQAQAAWSKFGGKASVLNALLAEQHYLCCYSELRADEEGWGYHIEHLENKSQNPARTFDPSNLLASAFTNQDLPTLKKQGRDVFGGHAPGKSQSVNMGRFVSPTRRFFGPMVERV